MTTEDDLRKRMDDAGGASRPIDADAVIRRSRMRRLPACIAVGAVGALAVGGIAIAVLPALSSNPSAVSGDASTAGSGSLGEPAAPETSGSLGQAPADRLNLCTGTLAEVAPAENGLEATAVFPATAPAGAPSVVGTVMLTNTGAQPVTGTTGVVPAVTLSRDGTVLWHSNGPTILSVVTVDLAPGASLTYPASFSAVRCSVDDDLGGAFREDLPAADPGSYRLSIAIDFVDENGTSTLVTGPPSDIVLQ